jgi:CheY-like chemotaxis protein
VLLAGAGPEALALLAGHPDPVHLLLADVRMPGMSGPEVARRARAGRPGLRVLLMTGHGGEALAEAGTDGDDLLEKPFTVEALAEAVRRALDA